MTLAAVVVHSPAVKHVLTILKLLVASSFLSGCQTPPPDITKATTSYPLALHTANAIPIQVTRDQEFITIVNSTATDFNNAVLWINQQYTQPLPPTLHIRQWHRSVWAACSILANNNQSNEWLKFSGLQLCHHKLSWFICPPESTCVELLAECVIAMP